MPTSVSCRSRHRLQADRRQLGDVACMRQASILVAGWPLIGCRPHLRKRRVRKLLPAVILDDETRRLGSKSVRYGA